MLTEKRCEKCSQLKHSDAFYKRQNGTDSLMHICIDCFKLATPEKKCNTCQLTKPLDEFPIHPSSFDGHKHTCTLCWGARQVQEKQNRVQYRITENKRKIEEREQSKKDNDLLKAYGYRWGEEYVWSEYFEEEEKQWVLRSPTKVAIKLQTALQEIAQLQVPHIGHSSTLWARDILSLPNVVILDTETTGLGKNDEIIEMAIIDTQGRTRMDMLLQCEMPQIPASTVKLHHITKFMLKDARTFPQIWDKLMKFLATREILIFNAEYDMKMLAQTAKRYHLPFPDLHVQCLMKQVSAYIGGPKQRYKLEATCYHFNIEQPNAHRALVDVQMSLKILLALASFATSKQG